MHFSKNPKISNSNNLEEKTIFSPFWSVLFLACLAIAIYIFSIPEQIAAFIIGFWFILIALLNPANGIYFIILCTPFFLGNSKRPWFLMIEFFVYMTIISAIIHKIWIQKKKWIFPYKYPILLFLGICFISLPINLKELFLELQYWPIIHSLRILGTSHEGFNLYYLRCLLNIISSIALYIIFVNFIRDSEGITRIFKPVVALSAFTVFIGFLLFFNIIPQGKFYLSLSLIGQTGGQFTALAYNPLYLGQYLIVIMPIAVFPLLGPKTVRAILFSLSSLSVFAIALVLAYQRTPYVVLFLQILFFSAIYRYYFANRGKKLILLFVSIIIFLILTLFITNYCFWDRASVCSLINIRKYFILDRLALLKTAWQMAKQFPLLGVGLGKFHFFFPEYLTLGGLPYMPYIDYMRTTAHNIYMHILAEQGFLGLGSFLLLIIGVFYSIFKSLKRLTIPEFNIVIVFATSLLGWLVYGMFQHMFYIRSIQIFFWIILAILAVALKPYMKPMRIPKRLIFGIGVFLLIILCHRIFIIRSYSIEPGYSVGFYNYELLPDGHKARWMGKRAAMKLPVHGNTLSFNIAAFIPGLDHRPQKLQIHTAQGYKHEIVLKDQNWVQVEIPVEKEKGNNIWVWLRTSYTIIPKRIGLGNDQRSLGVILEEIKWKTE